ncbi:MAG: GNAT family N-acetyltransferase [Candidatus Hermodarchaeia archaeon]|jgi:ribosomal protein S18 acetylase RimI-like enzyme
MSLTIRRLFRPSEEIEEYLRQDIPLNGLPLYDLTLGWRYCDWYVALEQNDIQGCVIIYRGGRSLASFLTRGTPESVGQLAEHVSYERLFAIVPEYHLPFIEESYHIDLVGKLALMVVDRDQYKAPETQPTERLTTAHLEEVEQFYTQVPAGAYNPRQLEFGPFHGIRAKGRLVSICGTIAYYPRYPGIGVIGNLMTLPEFQHRGFGASVLDSVIQDLFEVCQYASLLVEPDNKDAVRIYDRMGFTEYTTFSMGSCERREKPAPSDQ